MHVPLQMNTGARAGLTESRNDPFSGCRNRNIKNARDENGNTGGKV